MPVTIVFGTRTGTAEGLAKKLFNTLKKGNFEPELHDIGAYDRSRLPQERNLLVITSTYGDGEAPDNAADFHSWLMSAAVPRLEDVSYSVLSLGDSGYETHGRKRGGVCSTYFSDHLGSDTKPGVHVHSNPAFRLPADGNTPVVMVGPGTGIAPFRAFLEECWATGAKGKNRMFFGNPHRATDFLYQDEFAGFLADGTLDKLDPAWSRDQQEKIYAQDLMMNEGAGLWTWLRDGAAFYVCGDAPRMAKDVDRALHAVAVKHGGHSEEEAAAFILQLKKDRRYLRDVY